MYHSKDYRSINDHLAKTKKLLITTGCSFTVGTAAWDLDLVHEIPPRHFGGNVNYRGHSIEEKQYISNKYPEVFLSGTDIDLTQMERRNSFGDILARKYLNDEWTSANLGGNGNGNFSSILRLFNYPINYNLAEKIVVIFCMTSYMRYDLIRDDSHMLPGYIGNDFQTLWPNLGTPKNGPDENWRFMHDGFRECVYTDRWEVLSMIQYLQLLKTWCQAHQAEFVVLSAFDRYMTRDHVKNHLGYTYSRNHDTREINCKVPLSYESLQDSIDKFNMIPWDHFWLPEGEPSFFHLGLKYEPSFQANDISMYSFVQAAQEKQMVITPNDYLMGCAHPSAKLHDKLASLLNSHLANQNFL